MNHSFAICAYKESPYLEECIRSVLNQTISSEVLLVTSTPCGYLKNISNKYKIPYYINDGECGITQDWNFAISKCNTDIVTITHQDDVYYKEYAESVVAYMEKAKKPLIFFSDYDELRDGQFVHDNKLLKIKRVMLSPLRLTVLQTSRFVRRRILSFGSPICCPSVAFCIPNLELPIFNNHFKTNEDWEAWEKISKLKGEFLYCIKSLMAHRIHENSVTTAMIQDTGRTEEDIEMYCKFWPKTIAKMLARLYKDSERSNELK